MVTVLLEGLLDWFGQYILISCIKWINAILFHLTMDASSHDAESLSVIPDV